MAKAADVGKALATGTEMKPQVNTLETLIKSVNIKKRFEEMLGKKAAGFMSSILSEANAKKELKVCDPMSVIASAAIAASLDLPINQNLGFAHIVPYSGKAQFQMGWKGFVQLALRTGQYLRINALPVYKNQFKSWNALTELMDADFTVEPDGEVVGFAFYFKLVNGFEKTIFAYKKDLMAHGKRYSKAFAFGPWKTHEDEMCLKTLVKKGLGRWGIMSIEMQTALQSDQAVIKEDGTPEYIDTTAVEGSPEPAAQAPQEEAPVKDLAGQEIPFGND